MLTPVIAATAPQRAVLDAKIAAARERMDALRATTPVHTPPASVIIAETTAAVIRFGIQEIARHLAAMRESHRTKAKGSRR